MLRIALVFLFVVQVLTKIPRDCMQMPSDVENPLKCCKFPSVIKEEDLKECGIDMPAYGEDMKRPPPDCDQQLCVLRKYKLVKEDDSIDKTAVALFMDQWAIKNPSYKDAVEIAKNECIAQEPFSDVSGMCKTFKFTLCLYAAIFMNCPKYEELEGCQKVKEHNDECKQHFQ